MSSTPPPGRGGLVDTLPSWRRTIRYHLGRLVIGLAVRAYLRPRAHGLERLPREPYVLCFNHLGWTDPMILWTLWPPRPRLYLYGPREEDMRVGLRNRLIGWLGTAVPFNPGKTNLLESTRRAVAVLRAGHALGIAGEGGLSEHEGEVLPLNEGAAYFALRAGVPVVPVAIRGTRWLSFGKRIDVVVGRPIATAGMRADRQTVDALTAQLHVALTAMVAGATDGPLPGPMGSFLTDVFTHRSRFGRPAWLDRAEAEAVAEAVAAPPPAGEEGAGAGKMGPRRRGPRAADSTEET